MFGSNKKDADKIETKKADIVVKKRKGIPTRLKIGCIVSCLFIFVLCILAIIFLWFGGYIKNWTCDAVTEDSSISERLECNKEESVSQEGDGEYKYNVKDGEITISDQETVIVDVVENSSPSVVSIGLKGDQFSEDQIIGSGFIVTENGLIVTNRHVVSEGSEEDYFVIIKDREDPLDVTTIYTDALNDIALVKVESTDLPSLPLGDSSNLTVGQTVIAIGNPLGDLTGTVTSGIISGLNREVEVGANFFNTDVEAFEDVIQTDAAINPGNSGGPLINTNGEVIGVNFATIQGADNLSFAIPIDRVKLRIDELNQFGDFRIPFMGIEYRRRVVFIDDEALIGALVTSVFTSSPADKAGVEIGDVIVQYDDKTLEEESLFSLIQKSEIGEAVKIIVIRDGEQVSLDVVIGQQSKVE